MKKEKLESCIKSFHNTKHSKLVNFEKNAVRFIFTRKKKEGNYTVLLFSD